MFFFHWNSYFLMSMVALALLGTIEQLFLPSSLLGSFSLINSQRELVEDSSTDRENFIDTLKLTVIFASIAGHCFGCLESIPGWYTVNNLAIIKSQLQSIWVQPMLNEGGLGIGVTFVGGE